MMTWILILTWRFNEHKNLGSCKSNPLQIYEVDKSPLEVAFGSFSRKKEIYLQLFQLGCNQLDIDLTVGMVPLTAQEVPTLKGMVANLLLLQK